jgi:hypothetical protein
VECDSDKCDLKMVAILAAIFNMVAKTFSLKLEHFEILRILVAILKMAAKMTAILKSH